MINIMRIIRIVEKRALAPLMMTENTGFQAVSVLGGFQAAQLQMIVHLHKSDVSWSLSGKLLNG